MFQTPEASYHVIAPGRGGEVIDAFLAGAESEVWGSDLWAPQILTAATEHQICLSHQERDLTFAVDADTDEARVWGIELRHVIAVPSACTTCAARSRPSRSPDAGC